MDELQELAYILTKNKTKSIEIIGDDSRQYDSKLYQLFEAVQTGRVNTDQDAAQLIYGEAGISAKYRNLKHELKKRLLNTLFFVDSNNNSDRDKAYFQCWKDWAACRFLIEKSARKTAVSLAKKTLKKARQHDFFDLVSAISLLLRMHYALREKDTALFRHYDEIYEKAKSEEEYQNLAHKYYMQLVLDHTIESVTANPKIEQDARKYSEELEPLKEETSNIKFHYYLYQIKLLGTMGVFEYQSAKQVCAEAISYLQASETEFKGGIRNFLLNKLVCHIQLKEFEEGKTTAMQCRDFISEGAFNWFKTNEYFFMLSFHTENYQEAYNIYTAITNHPRYKAYKILHETWSLYRMYLHFLYLLKKIKPAEEDKSFRKLRLGKFINEVPSFSKDKHGMNIPVLIAQMAFLILQRKYDAAAERIDALNKYCDRYLKTNNPNFRCNCFIKMLVQIPISGFHPAGTDRRAKNYLKKMQTIEINFNNQAHEVEVLPFETMWGFILEALQNRKS